MFEWDPARRITAREALGHGWFQEEGGVNVKWVYVFLPYWGILMQQERFRGQFGHLSTAKSDA